MAPLRLWQFPFALAQLLATASAQGETPSSSLESEFASTSTTFVYTSESTLATITGTPTATTGPTGEPKVHTVQVGMGGFSFTPKELKDVQKGDTITFEFFPPDHSVARAEFGSPCVPYEYTGKDKQGFWSDVQMVETVAQNTYWNLTVNDTAPIFYYCGAPGSCLDHQMIGVINPNSTQTFAAQEQAAKDATIMVKPGEPIPKEGTATLHAPGATSTSSPDNPSDDNHSSGKHISKSVIIGASVGGVLFLAVCAALFFYVGRNKSLKEAIERKDATVSTKAMPTTPAVSDFGLASPGYGPQSPYSPNMNQMEYGALPPYVQSVDGRSPHQSMAHMSMMSQNRMSSMYAKQDVSVNPAYAPVEIGSPEPGEQSFFGPRGQTPGFTAELEAPLKSPR